MSDVVDQIKWAQDHDAEVEQIAKNGREFALERLTQEHSLHYLYRMLMRLSDIQDVFINPDDDPLDWIHEIPWESFHSKIWKHDLLFRLQLFEKQK